MKRRSLLNKATDQQVKPHGTGRDVINLAKEDVLTQPIVVPEHALQTLELWARSAAAYLKRLQLEDEGVIVYPVSIVQIARGLQEDLEGRAQLGEQRYGERLRAFNGRSALTDAYQEALDCWVYLRQNREEQEFRK
jgi:hypothetical protein